jgi:methionine biosynthesis protein MetW
MGSNGRRPDLDVIIVIVAPRARVLDLGCGDGELLAKLVATRQVIARGVEISEALVRACIAKGLSVRQGNIEEGLADYPDGAFDYVVLSQTIAYLNRPAPVVREMLRVGRRAIISFDNAGNWAARLRMALGQGFGEPLGSGEPRERAITLGQFEAFAEGLGANVEKRVLVRNQRMVTSLPELMAQTAVYVLRQRDEASGGGA